MSLKSKSIFKNFSAVFLLLLIVTAVFIPFEAAKAGLGDLVSFNVGSILEDFIAKLLLGDNILMRAIYCIAYQLLNICLLVVTILVYFGSWLIDVFLDEQIYIRVLDMKDPTSAVSIGWTTIRDACNTFFILFLLLIAFSTILRIQTYNAKSLLPKFIISLFLINFSATIAMMVIDFGQVFMFEIKSWMGAGGFSTAGSPLTSIVDYFNNEYTWKSPSESYILSDVVGVGFAVAYSVILGLLYIMLALFLLVRIIVFVVLVIISPFAFFSIILPGMRTYTSQWWSSLVSHAIFGPVFLFFIFLSGKMAQSMHGFASVAPEPGEISPLSFIIAELIPHVVALGMLFAAIPVTQKLGAAGSSKIIGGAAGIGKIAAGTYAGVKLAGGLGKKTGGGIDNRIMKGKVSDWGRRKKEGVLKSRALLGLGKGTALKSQAETERKKEDNMKKVRLEFGEAKSRDLDLLQQKANGKLATKEDKALFAETAVAHGKSGEEGYAKDIARFMPEIERTLSGKELSEITDKNLVLATHTSEAQKDIKSDAKTDEQIMKEKMDDIVADGKAHEVQGLDNAMATKAWHDGQTSEQRKSSMNRMNKERRNELADGYMANANRAGTEEGDRMEFSSNAVKLEKGLDKAFAWGGDDAAEKIKEAFSDFDHKTVAKLSSGDLDKHGYNTTDKQITGLEKAGEYKTVRRIKDSMAKHDPEKLNRINSGITNPTGAESGGGTKGTKPEESGKVWEEKMKQKTGGGGGEGPRGSGGSDNPKPDSIPNPKGGGGGGRASGSYKPGDADNSKKSRRSILSDEGGSMNLIGGVGSNKDKSSKDKLSSKSESQSKGTEAQKADAPKENIEKVVDAFSHKPIIGGKTIKAGLKVGGKFDKRIKTVGEVVSPLIEGEMKKEKEIEERRKNGEDISATQELKEKIGMAKEPLKTTISENADEGVKKAADRAGAALDKIGEGRGKLGAAAKVTSKVVGDERVRKATSGKIKKLTNQDKKVSVEDLEMKDIKKEYGIRKDMNKAVIGTEQLNVAKESGKNKNSMETYSKLSKSKEGKRALFDDRVNDINYKMAKAKQNGGSGAKEVRKFFAEKKKMAKEFVEETNPDLMKDIRYEEGMIEKTKAGGHGGERLNRGMQTKRRGNLDQLRKKKEAKVNEVLDESKGFREREAIRTKKKIKEIKSNKNYVDLSKTKTTETPLKTPTNKKAETEPQSKKA